METQLKVLHLDVSTGFYRLERFPIGCLFGPVDLGLYLTDKHGSLSFGAGLLAGSVFPGSNRLVFTGYSPCWDGAYVSSMGGAALVFDNLGINLVSIHHRAPTPSVLYLNREHGEEVQVELLPVDPDVLWADGQGVYGVMSWVHERFGGRYKTDPRILAVGPAARSTDFGGIVSVPIEDGKLTHVDTWAGRGGLGSQLLQAHGIVAVIYGGTVIDDDFRDRNVANQWFEDRYHKRMAAKDMEATVKYRFDEKLDTGGTLGVNYSKVGGGCMAFNYDTIFATEAERKTLHEKLIHDHYLKQFNEDLKAAPKSQTMRNCGEPCVAVCKKMRDIYKKDYEPYQTLGPLAGVFDQRAAERLNHHGDAMGFDAISLGGVVSWLMGCLDDGVLKPEELGVPGRPVWKAEGFRAEADSSHNADIGVALIDGIIARRSALDLSGGARRLAKTLAHTRGRKPLDLLVFTANARHGWMVPNQYWTPGVLSPMPIMGKYYNHYASEYLPPRALGRMNVERMKQELVMDNVGYCRFHRGWAEEMIPDIIGDLFGQKQAFVENVAATARLINRRNAAVFWESERNLDYVSTSLIRMRDQGAGANPDLAAWVDRFQKDKWAAGFDYWFEVRKGIEEAFTETF